MRLTMMDLLFLGVGWTDLAIALNRIAVGAFFMLSAFRKLFNAERHRSIVDELKALGVPAVGFNRWWVPLVEFTGGAAVLDGAVHPLRLAVCPGMVGLGEPMLDPVLIADAIEDVNPPSCGRTGAVSRRVCELEAIVGQHDPYLVGKDLDDFAQESCANYGVRRLVELDIGELRDAIDGKEHVDLAFGQAQLADIDMDLADGGLREPTALRHRLSAHGKAADPMAFEAAMQSAA
jgi:hypothetical protein